MSQAIADPLLQSLDQIRDMLSPSARKSLDALISIVQSCGGKSLPEVSKELKKMIQKERKSLPMVIKRAEALLAGGADEGADSWLADAVKLTAVNKKKFATHFGIELSTSKDEASEELRRWIESRGRIKPPPASERAARNLNDVLSQVKQIQGNPTIENLKRMIDIVDSVKQRFDVPELLLLYEVFGFSPTGKTKAALHKELVRLLKNMIVSRSQVDGIREMG